MISKFAFGKLRASSPIINNTLKQCRNYSEKRVPLHSSIVTPKKPTVQVPNNMIYLHGLFGSGANWRSIASVVSDETGYRSHLLDARNHGQSPHTKEMGFSYMVDDLLSYLESQNIKKATLLGHSMGGKWAMNFAQLHPELVEKLVVVDVAPVTYNHYGYHCDIMEYMKQLDLENIKSRKEADQAMAPYIKEDLIRSFILQNLVADPDNPGHYKWRLNIDTLKTNLNDWIDGDSFSIPYEGETLFIGGSKSNYIKNEYHPRIRELFPNSSILMVDEGNHYLHFVKRDEFLKRLLPFLKN